MSFWLSKKVGLYLTNEAGGHPSSLGKRWQVGRNRNEQP